MRPITTIIVHHTDTAPTATPEEIGNMHEARGISRPGGYHVLIHQDVDGGYWRISELRPLRIQGAHDKGQNAASVGVAIAGQYHQGEVPSDGWNALVLTCASLCRRFGLTSNSVEGHGENEPPTTPTLCPGFDADELRMAIDDYLNIGALT